MSEKELQNVATYLHNELCGYSHTDQCAWDYELCCQENDCWEREGSTHNRWLKYAENIMRFCKTWMIDVETFVAIKKFNYYK